jgi:hypothetical protein
MTVENLEPDALHEDRQCAVDGRLLADEELTEDDTTRLLYLCFHVYYFVAFNYCIYLFVAFINI